ncbi:LysR family transcriptional regulator [Thioclava sp. GXIMD4215]
MLTDLTGADLRALHVFQTICACGSFAAAERKLDVRQSTISVQIANLERRLGFRLCDRGPGGLRLTERGRTLLEASARLNLAVESFTQTAAALTNKTVGTLRLGLMDHLSNTPSFSVSRLLRGFHELAPEVNLQVVQDIQSVLVDQILNKSLDMAIGAFPASDAQYDRLPLYKERQFIHCGPLHPFFKDAPQDYDAETLEAQRWVRRSYRLDPEAGFPLALGPAAATAANLEAVGVILSALPVLGYLPSHAAASFVTRNEIRRVTDNYSVTFEVSLISRAGQRDTAAMRHLRDLAVQAKKRR